MEFKTISNVIKEYPTMLQITIYHNSYNLPAVKFEKKPDNPITEHQRQLNRERSLRRSKQAVRDIISCNDFEYWCTFTFNPKKVDRYNFYACKSKMSNWLHRQRNHSPDFRYVIVPEYHKDGGVHFHALFANWNGTLKDSGIKRRNRTIYNATGYRSGFTEIIKLNNNTNDQLATYITKQYITKDMPLIAGKRYWASKGLNRPQSYTNGLDKFNLWSIVKNRKPEFINQDIEIHNIPITSSVDYKTDNYLNSFNL